MAITLANQQNNHRGVYVEVVGDGSTTSFSVSLPHIPNRTGDETGTAYVVTSPTGFQHGHSGRGGFLFPDGTAVAVTSASVSAGVLTVVTTAAIGNGTRGYVAYVFNESSARG